ncbi:MAG: ATP-binding protein [Lentimicrobium sp.]
MNYIHRDIEQVVRGAADSYRIVTITGPRQSGKTTLVRNLFGHLPYYSLESPDTRYMIQQDPRGFLNSNKEGAIIDEAQVMPELFSYLQEVVDLSDNKCLFVLTGSNHFLLMNRIAQSLAGRTAILTLLPLSFNEMNAFGHYLSTDETMLHGFYPGIFSNQLMPTMAYRSYHETYIQKDIRTLANLKDLSLFEKFIRLCAGRIGNMLNVSALANETGVSSPTIQSWMSLLEASYAIFLLPPFYDNISKRLVKSPKLYFYDTGLACYLLGIENTKQLARDPLRGALFENMVVMEALKSHYNKGLGSNLYFYRDNHLNEVDLILREGTILKPYEIKSSQTFNADFLRGIRYLAGLMPERISEPHLIYDGSTESRIGEINVVNYRNMRFD